MAEHFSLVSRSLLKVSGLTFNSSFLEERPYSRGGDGKAALGPMLREYIISEAMNALGISTTRSLTEVTTGESVIRETELTGAILTRVASSHLRVGTFQYASKWGTTVDLKVLADYTLQRHFPDVEADDLRYLSLLKEMISRNKGGYPFIASCCNWYNS
jgi:serine/tyrosine/threonine adenylyltransferase